MGAGDGLGGSGLSVIRAYLFTGIHKVDLPESQWRLTDPGRPVGGHPHLVEKQQT
jgi:hypothetical protein